MTLSMALALLSAARTPREKATNMAAAKVAAVAVAKAAVAAVTVAAAAAVRVLVTTNQNDKKNDRDNSVIFLF